MGITKHRSGLLTAGGILNIVSGVIGGIYDSGACLYFYFSRETLLAGQIPGVVGLIFVIVSKSEFDKISHTEV
jgi:hypothetical protein